MSQKMNKENKKVICSIALTPDLKNRIKKLAMRKGMSFSELAGELFQKVLMLDPDQEFEIRNVK